MVSRGRQGPLPLHAVARPHSGRCPSGGAGAGVMLVKSSSSYWGVFQAPRPPCMHAWHCFLPPGARPPACLGSQAPSRVPSPVLGVPGRSGAMQSPRMLGIKHVLVARHVVHGCRMLPIVGLEFGRPQFQGLEWGPRLRPKPIIRATRSTSSLALQGVWPTEAPNCMQFSTPTSA